jgi:hypothetical protein
MSSSTLFISLITDIKDQCGVIAQHLLKLTPTSRFYHIQPLIFQIIGVILQHHYPDSIVDFFNLNNISHNAIKIIRIPIQLSLFPTQF